MDKICQSVYLLQASPCLWEPTKLWCTPAPGYALALPENVTVDRKGSSLSGSFVSYEEKNVL
jgi:hypothetical protein